MSKLPGINVPMGIVPNDIRDEYPTHYAEYGKGGYRCAATVEEMNAIPALRLENGCVCYVVSNGNEYRWSNDEWSLVSKGGGTAGSDAHKEMDFETPASTWNCAHGLGKKPAVTIVDGKGQQIIADVIHESDNSLVVYFGKPQFGKIILN